MAKENPWKWHLKDFKEVDETVVATVVAENPAPSYEIKHEDLPEHYGQYLVDGINRMSERILSEGLQSLETKIVNMMNFYGHTLTIKLERYQK